MVMVTPDRHTRLIDQAAFGKVGRIFRTPVRYITAGEPGGFVRNDKVHTFGSSFADHLYRCHKCNGNSLNFLLGVAGHQLVAGRGNTNFAGGIRQDTINYFLNFHDFVSFSL